MPRDRDGVRYGGAPSEESALAEPDSPVREEGASGLEDTNRVLSKH
jgi:hypothetical protein